LICRRIQGATPSSRNAITNRADRRQSAWIRRPSCARFGRPVSESSAPQRWFAHRPPSPSPLGRCPPWETLIRETTEDNASVLPESGVALSVRTFLLVPKCAKIPQGPGAAERAGLSALCPTTGRTAPLGDRRIRLFVRLPMRTRRP
jgi:hypothetical protein